jgi:flagellin-like hook-associated protein FlgL
LGLTIQGNPSAAIANRSLQQADRALTRALDRLATGKNAPSFRYDTSGSAVAARIRSDLGAWRITVQNATQATAMLQIAEGAYQRGEDMLVRMRALSAQAQSVNLSNTERAMLNTEYQQIKNEIDRLAKSANFAGTALFDLGATAGFGAQTTASSGLTGMSGNAVETADMNGDGIMDIVTAGNNGVNGIVNVAYGLGDGSFAASTQLFVNTGAFIGNIAIGDFNGDGRMDVVTNNSSAGNTQIYLQTTPGSFSRVYNNNLGAGMSRMEVADMNGDGRADIVAAGGNNVAVLNLDSNGAVQATTITSLNSIRGLALGDMDNDGDVDAVVSDGGGVRTMFNNGSGALTAGTVTGAWMFGIRLADMNNDGRLDAVGRGIGGASIDYQLNTGSGNFAATQFLATGATSNLRDTWITDVNGDGMLDILAFGVSGTSMQVRMGTGTLAFATAYTVNLSTLTQEEVVLADLNRDNRLDILTSTGATQFGYSLSTTQMGLEGNFRVGPSGSDGNNIAYRLGSMRVGALDADLLASNITTAANAKTAERDLLSALDVLRRYRTQVAAGINRMEKVVDNATTIVENMDNARSAYEDLDVAQEMTEFLAKQMMVQAGISMLTQANTSQKNILRLLQAN